MMNASLNAKLREMEQPGDASSDASAIPVEKQPKADVTLVDEDLGSNATPPNAETPVMPVADAPTSDTDTASTATLQAQIEELRKEVERLTATNVHLQQRWQTFAGMHKSQVTVVAHENEALKAELAVLRKKLESVPQSSIAEDTLIKRFGKDVWDRMDEDEQQRWVRTEEAHQADSDALRKTVYASQASPNSDKAEKFWSKVEVARPGFRAAMEDYMTGLPTFLDTVNPDSTEGMTYRKCIDMAASTGHVQTVISIADQFSELDGRKFSASGDEAVPLNPRPPASTPATSTSHSQSTVRAPVVTAKPSFSKDWANQFLKEAMKVDLDQRRLKRFQPFKFKLGNFERIFKTVADVRKMRLEVEDAELDNRWV